MPIYAGGEFFGTLCAIDPRPANLSAPETRATFELFAELIGTHLRTQGQLAASEAALLDERQTAELREQFMAVLGHDLRNPLASIAAGAQRLEKAPLDQQSRTIVSLMRQSAARMSLILENVLDLARGRLGGGINLNRSTDATLSEDLLVVIEELRTVHGERVFEVQLSLDHAVAYDRRRLGQLASNLIANALTHGAAETPIIVRAATSEADFVFEVSNGGAPIPLELHGKLFEPFARGATPSAQGLGLGLYIANEIARAHGGALTFTSGADLTTFTLRMPRA